MQRKFGDRVRAAMLAAGIETPVQLAKKCGVSRQTATKWLAMKQADLTGENLIVLSDAVNARVHWLVTGEGPIALSARLSDRDVARAAAILEHLTAEQCKRWLAMGEKLAGRR